MRVLVIMPSIPLQGMERSTLKIAAALKAGGAQVRMVLEERWATATHAAAAALGLDVVKIPHAPGPARTFNPLRWLRDRLAWGRCAARVAAIEREFAPTHIYVTNLSFFLLSLRAIRASAACVVFRLPNPPDANLRGLRRMFANYGWRHRVLPNCDAVVCNSDYTAGLVRALGAGGPAPQVIRNMVTRPPAQGASDAPRLEPGRFHAVYMGRIRPEKGVGLLLEAALALARELPDVDFHLAGEKAWRNPFATDWERRLQQAGMARRIRLLGEIEDVPGLVAQAQVHVCPSVSRNESFPNAVLEAKSQGVPSIVFPVAGLPEAVTHGGDGHVCGEITAASLAEGIRALYADRERCRALGRQAKASLTRYDDALIGEQWRALYRGCTRRRSA